MKKLILTLTTLFLLAGSMFANGLENENAIGMFIIGADQPVGGLQYEHRFSNLFSTKMGVFAFYNNDAYADPYNMNFTVETDFTLFENNWKDKICSRLFAYGLIGYAGKMERHYEYTESTGEKKSQQMHNNAVASAGFGFDFIFFDHLSVPIQFGFLGTFPDDPQVGFCAGIGIRYTW